MLFVEAYLVWHMPQTPEPVCCPSLRCVACHCLRQLRCMYLQTKTISDIVPFSGGFDDAAIDLGGRRHLMDPLHLQGATRGSSASPVSQQILQTSTEAAEE